MEQRPNARPMTVEGRAWAFVRDGIDTDAMMPGRTLRMTVEDATPYLLSLVREGWAEEVAVGDVLVGGTRFGIGSSRPVARLLLHAGIRCVIAEEMASLFQRNCVNFGLPALEVPGITEGLEDGDVLHIDLRAAEATNQRTGQVLAGKPFPDLVLGILEGGGLLQDLARAGFTKSGSGGS